MIRHIKKKILWKLHERRWYQKNRHNFCAIQFPFDMEKVEIGKYTYGMINAHIYQNPHEYLKIGSFCSISENVHFVFGEHNYKRFSTYAFNHFLLGQQEIDNCKGPIIVEDDVWIGMNVTILSGVTIHQGAVIGAGSVVTHDVPPYAIFCGNRIVKYRFSQDVIDKLSKINYNQLTLDKIKKYHMYLYQDISEDFFESELYKSIIH